MRKLYKLILSLIVSISIYTTSKAQTTLAAGDLAFSGYVSGGNGTTISDRFSFVLLVPVTANTVIKFTDYGWRTDLSAFSSGVSLESEYTLTISGALPAGTEIHITTNNITGNPTPTATLVGGGSAGTIVVSVGASFLAGNMALSTTGDQIFAYQGTFASPTFISGIHKNAYNTVNGDPSTTSAAAWDGVIASGSLNTNSSGLPAALTTGTNAIWIGAVSPTPPLVTEWDNAFFACGPDVSTAALARAALNNQANWTKSDGAPAFTLPTGCNYLNVLSAPTINTNPSNSTVCEGANASFSITATGALTYQWQVDNGGGFANVTDNATYSGATTATLNITAAPASFNGYIYRCVASNGSGSTNSTGATLTVTALPVNPTLLAKTPNTATVADGTPVSATFNAGSGGTGCTDDFRYTTNGGATYLPYTPGSNISTTGLAAGTGVVTIEGRRAGCATCSGSYVALATWIVTPLPAAATTLNAGDIAFSGYISAAATDEFSFVLLRNIGPGTVINFTDNGWLSTNVFATGEQTCTWTSNAAYAAGTEIHISGLTATLASGGSAGTVTGTALSLSTSGDQILAYRGTAAAPTFISAIHMNVFTIAGGDAVNTTAAAWDGTATGTSASALPTGLTTGTNCIWIGTQGVAASEFENARYGTCSNPATLGAISSLRAALNNQANWTKTNGSPAGFSLPTGCPYLGVGNPPNITTNPAAATVCEGANANFTIVAGGATSYQWQEDAGSGFVNISDNSTYSGTNTASLTINATPLSFNGRSYRCIATNGSGSSTSTGALLTVNVLPAGPTLLAKTPAGLTVADGTPVSATFNAGSGGTGCSDDFRYTTDGGLTYLSYTPGSNISTTGLAAGSGYVFIEGRRANCSAGCQGNYVVLALWRVTPLPAAATTLNAGDIAFSGYTSTTPGDDFSFVLLKNVGAGTTINFTNNGWLSTNVFRTGEETVTWTAPAGGLFAGTEISISGLTATRSGGGAAGTVTGTQLNLSTGGDQILAYRGTAASPTFISAIHMNVYSTLSGDPVTTTAAAWDGTANTASSSALPTGLTTGVNAIWIGTQDVPASEFDNARYGVCNLPAVSGSIAALRAALNNQANWTRNNNTPPGFTLPTGCNYLQMLVPTITVTGTPLAPFAACEGSNSPEQSFTVAGSALIANIIITAPAGFEISTTSGSGFNSSLTLTPSGGSVPTTTIYVRTTTAASGTPSGNITIASTGVTTINEAVSATIGINPTAAAAGPDAGNCGLTYTLAGNIPSSGTGAWTQQAGPGTASFTDATLGNTSVTVDIAGAYTFRWTITGSGVCPVSFDEVIITFSSTPTVAAAGPDATACITPGTFTMAANAPAVGTGTWSQAPGGPATAIIFTPGSATSNIGGLTTAGVYTFVWSISNGVCPVSRDTMTITVNPNPAAFTIGGGGTYCPSNITLTGPSDPNYTYIWERSLSGIANPNSFTAFGGTAQTQVVNISGNYRLRVTNQFGCATTDTASVSIADYVFNGSLAAGDATQTGRLNRFGVVSTCAAPKACPGTFATTGARLYDSYTITNPRNVPVCATIGIASGCGVNMFSVAYTGSYNPAALCTNYLADPGSSFPNVGYYEATIPANGSIVVIVHEVNTGTGCANYQLTVDVPRDLSAINAAPPSVVCNGTSVLTAPVANTYLWNPGGATTQSITTPPLFVPTTFDVTLGYGNNGCTRLESVTVGVTSLPPAVTCPANITLSNTTGQCGRIVTYSTTVTGLPAPTVTYALTGATTGSGAGDGSGSFFNVGTTTVTVTVTNSCGTANCAFTVTINDTEPPTVTAGTIAGCYPTAAAAEAAALAATSATDNCPGTLTETASTVGTCSAVVTVRTTDAAGNFTDVTYNTRIDNTPPTVTTGTIASCYPTVAAAEAAALAATSATDNCPGTLTETASTVGTCSAVITVTTTDGCGNTTAVTYNTRIDNTPPTVTTGTIASCYPTVAAAEAAALAATSATDNCPGTLTEVASTVGTCSAVITVTTTDGCGNFTSVTYNTRIDGTAPTVTCPAPVTVSCAANVPAPNTSLVIATDNCPGTLTTIHVGDVISAQTCANRFTVTRTYRVTDGCGNFAECTQIITVNDQTPPSITCPAPVTVSCASAVPAPNTSLVTATDNCAGVVTITHIGDVISNQTCANRYTITRTYRATDVCGNFAECTQIIAVNDQTPPVITCPAPVTVSCASAVPAPNTALVTATDNCAGVVTITHIGDVISNQTCANRYTITRTYRATDVCGNFAECTQIITVNDQTPPVITCPAPVTVSCASAVPAPNTALVTATDNCAGVITITHISDVISNQTCANRYTVTRTYRATDVCGNFSECTQIITVNDQTPPVITCPAAITVACASAVPAPNTALVTATDNCAGVITITHISDVITNQTCPNRYTLTRTYRATDVCGNFSECTQIITVNDNIAPVITCPANITVTTPFGSCVAVVNFAATATDNCGGTITFNYSHAPGSSFPIGTTTVTATATDACGNSSNCSFTITVIDAQAPVITQQPANRTVCVGQNATFTVAAITSPTAGGPLSYQWQQWNGSAWVNIAGATGTSHTVNSVTLSMNTNTFRVVVTGLCTVINSNAATLFVNPVPTISLTAFPLSALLPNQTTNINATVNPAGGSFVWSFNGSPLTGVTGPSYGPINVNGIGSYTVVYTDLNGCVSSPAQITIGAQFSNNLWVSPNPNTGTFNVRFYNQTGEQVTVKVFNGGGQEVYSQALTLGVAYSNITVNLGNAAAGVYVVKVINSSGLELASRRIVVYH